MDYILNQLPHLIHICREDTMERNTLICFENLIIRAKMINGKNVILQLSKKRPKAAKINCACPIVLHES